jgi:ABC-type polysaccharide/polyol phosphate transport system ATPase subunit
MARIVLDDVSLTFKIRQRTRITFKEFLVRRMFKKSVNPYFEIKALQNLSIDLRDGDRLGILGHNGAGKSTMLRVLAGVYPPTAGGIAVEGKVSSLFDINLGFEPDASGWENIYYRGYLQGETPHTIRAKMQPIADFSELGTFLDMPVCYYSSGMKVRLAFAIATAIEPEILLIDEVLGVGDKSFQDKAARRMRDMMEKARLMVFVSHDLDSLIKICNRALWLDHGRVLAAGEPGEVAAAYTRHVEQEQAQQAA